MELRFAKYEGLGNDFLIVELTPDALSTAQVVALCDRHRGVGGDGVLFVGGRAAAGAALMSAMPVTPAMPAMPVTPAMPAMPAMSAMPVMRVVNSDGSVPEMCGNGLRCVALHLSRTGAVAGDSFEVDTDSGPHRCVVHGSGASALIEVAMRPASLVPSQVPVIADAPLVDAAFEVGGSTLKLTAVSMGNPHAVVFGGVGESRLRLGPLLQADARFPRGVNVGFASDLTPAGFRLDVLERGAGWTQACGTGACAAAVAAVETGRAQRGTPIEVRLPGGALTIVVGERAEPVRMTGPARHVFDGHVVVD